MSNATLIDLLDLWGIDLRVGASVPVMVVRHGRDSDGPRRLYNLGIEQFERYQAAQKTRKFGDAKILVSFINTERLEADFVGVYRVHGHVKGNADSPIPERLPKDLLERCSSNYYYSLTRDTEFDQI
jgi:hypothetical protein